MSSFTSFINEQNDFPLLTKLVDMATVTEVKTALLFPLELQCICFSVFFFFCHFLMYIGFRATLFSDYKFKVALNPMYSLKNGKNVYFVD